MDFHKNYEMSSFDERRVEYGKLLNPNQISSEAMIALAKKVRKLVNERKNRKKNENAMKCCGKCKLTNFSNETSECSQSSSTKECHCSKKKETSLSISFKPKKNRHLANLKRATFKDVHDELKLKVLALEMGKMCTFSSEKIQENKEMET